MRILYVHPLLDNASLKLAAVRLPAGLDVLHVLQLQPEGRHVLLTLQQEDSSGSAPGSDPWAYISTHDSHFYSHRTTDVQLY